MEPWFSIDGPWKSPMAFYFSSTGIPWFVCICMWPQCFSRRCGAGKGLLSVDLADTLEWTHSKVEKIIFFFRVSSGLECHVRCGAGRYPANWESYSPPFLLVTQIQIIVRKQTSACWKCPGFPLVMASARTIGRSIELQQGLLTGFCKQLITTYWHHTHRGWL